jgi:hypothetical protein
MNGVTFWQAYAAANRRPSTTSTTRPSAACSPPLPVAPTIRAIITGSDTAGDAPRTADRRRLAQRQAGSPLPAAQAIAMWNEGVIGGSWHPDERPASRGASPRSSNTWIRPQRLILHRVLLSAGTQYIASEALFEGLAEVLWKEVDEGWVRYDPSAGGPFSSPRSPASCSTSWPSPATA